MIERTTCIRFSVKRIVYLAIGLAVLAILKPALAEASTVSVDWSAPSTGRTTAKTFGSNDEMCGQFSDGARDPAYAADLTKIGVGFLRLHSSTVEDWTTNHAWDRKKIATELNAPYVRACGDSNIIITIDIVPSWCRNIDNSINNKEYAAFCAQLVTIVNKDMGRKVKYWECMNEASSWADFANDNWAPMFSLYNASAQAMKAVDPTIKVGGNVLTWYDDRLANQYLTHCWSNVDFLSWHIYMIGHSVNPPLDGSIIYSEVMRKIPRFDTEISEARRTIASVRSHGYTDGHPIPLAIDEFNIPADWRYTGCGQDGYIGAAFFAAALADMANAHIDITANWSAKEENYGLVDMNDQMRLPAYVYEFANHDLIGSVAASRSDDPDCKCLAIYRGAQVIGDKHAFLLVNAYHDAKSVTLEDGLAIGQDARITMIDKSGMHTSMRTINSANPWFVMPGFSVATITMQ